MSKITIVCCYNNEKMYNDFVASLKTQNIDYELIGINNVNNKSFSSCSRAYNSIINDVKTKYVIYSHQDILFAEKDTLQKFLSHLEKIKTHDILGVAGVRFYEDGIFSNITDPSPCQYNKVNEDIIECDTIDECFFGGYTEHFREYKFDEKICNSWHFYGVEACLRTKSSAKIRNGGGGTVWVSSINLIHNSLGNTDYDFYWQFFRLCRKYRKHFRILKTTCVGTRTNIIYSLHRLLGETKRIFLERLKKRR